MKIECETYRMLAYIRPSGATWFGLIFFDVVVKFIKRSIYYFEAYKMIIINQKTELKNIVICRSYMQNSLSGFLVVTRYSKVTIFYFTFEIF